LGCSGLVFDLVHKNLEEGVPVLGLLFDVVQVALDIFDFDGTFLVTVMVNNGVAQQNLALPIVDPVLYIV